MLNKDLIVIFLSVIISVAVSKRCPESTFACRNGEQCVDKDFKCDGEKDCSDGSDERDCIQNPINPNEKYSPDDPDFKCPHPNLFTCKDKVCINKKFVCDDNPDCADGSDEYASLCKTWNRKRWQGGGRQTVPKDFKCPHNLFTCGTKECILPIYICDGNKDCSDGSDEWSENCKFRNDNFRMPRQPRPPHRPPRQDL
ncbi:DgyrCDS6646 [Dimorphilus gyrociliatus]|uniref:DgyrCDS6646 n=1 Tax=Dimorphilus gyrociliatus TaxID=2664684 RepID=A0A7I8VNS3_9ANNE|nr:DgyrCDS6646 [Dimorphilus gyrociliatus]